MKIAIATAIVACLLAPGLAQAQQEWKNKEGGLNTSYGTVNKFKDRYVWITIYDLGKTQHHDYGCVDPQKAREWTSGNYSKMGVYHIRAEVMTDPGCKGRKICDTDTQVFGGGTYNILQNKTDPNKCYIEQHRNQ